MSRFGCLLLAVLFTFSVFLDNAQAGIMDKMKRCADVLLGIEPPQRRQSKELSDLTAMLLRLTVERVVQKQEERRNNYKKAREIFLASFKEGADRDVAVMKLEELNYSSGDEADLTAFATMLRLTFLQLNSSQFRLLAHLMLARADFFQKATDVNRVIQMLVDEAPQRQLSSADIALLQMDMIKGLADYRDAFFSIEAMAKIFGDWALNIDPSDLYMVVEGARKEIKTYESKMDQEKAISHIREFAKKYKISNGGSSRLSLPGSL